MKTRSWSFYAIITFAVTLFIVGSVYLALSVYRHSLIASYTSKTPAVLEVPAVSREDRKALQGKWSQFLDTLQEGQAAAPLTMSPYELNVFISMIKEFRDRVVLGIEENRIRVEFATPLDELGLEGRYANGVALLDMKVGQNGLPVIEPVSVKLNGKSPPEWVQSRLDNPRDLDKVQSFFVDASLWKHVRNIEIKDGLLVFTPKNLK
jgi:hypothetical protein